MVAGGLHAHHLVMSARGRHVDRNRPRCRALGAASWLLLAVLLLTALRRDGTPTATLTALGPLALFVSYWLTRGWVWHNKQLYRVKGARTRVPVHEATWTHDRLGRELSGPRVPACGADEVVLSIDGLRKTYR